jgi:hypothetical protein
MLAKLVLANVAKPSGKLRHFSFFPVHGMGSYNDALYYSLIVSYLDCFLLRTSQFTMMPFVIRSFSIVWIASLPLARTARIVLATARSCEARSKAGSNPENKVYFQTMPERDILRAGWVCSL